MISLPSDTRIWLVAGTTDMRKSFNGLGEQVQHVLSENPFSGHLFIFRGRRGDTVKILWADADGLCLFTKRLEEGQFIWPVVRDGKIALTRSQLASTAEEALKRIGGLYAIEEEIRGHPEAERLAVRQSRSKPQLVSLHEWLVEKSTTLSKKTRLGEAFAYTTEPVGCAVLLQR